MNEREALEAYHSLQEKVIAGEISSKEFDVRVHWITSQAQGSAVVAAIRDARKKRSTR